MNKRILLLLCILPVTAALILYMSREPASQTQFTIGIINPNPRTKTIQETFMHELQNIAEQEGWDLTFSLYENKETLDADLKELVSKNPDLILTVTTPSTLKTREVFKGLDVPGIFVLFDPIQAGVINNLSEPGGNFTGIQVRGSAPKALDWLLDISPEIKNIFVPIKFDSPSASMSLDDLKKASKALGAQLHIAEVNTQEELNTALDSIPPETDAIFLLHSIFISANSKSIVQAAINKQLPTAASLWRDKDGILLSYGAPHELLGKQASRLADLIMHGQQPKELPAEIADFYFIVNLKTAETIGLQIPDSILAQADKLIR